MIMNPYLIRFDCSTCRQCKKVNNNYRYSCKFVKNNFYPFNKLPCDNWLPSKLDVRGTIKRIAKSKDKGINYGKNY